MQERMTDVPEVSDKRENVDPEEVYSPPAITWSEPYEPVGFGLSCAKQEGNPGCFPGPIFS